MEEAPNPANDPGSGGMALSPDAQSGGAWFIGETVDRNPNPNVKPGGVNVLEMSNKPGAARDPQWLNTFVTQEDGKKQIQPLGVLVGVGLIIWLIL